MRTPYGPSWGQWGPIGSKKWVKTVKKLPCLKIRIFDFPAVNNFSQKMEFTVIAPNNGGYPLGSIKGPMGSHWVQKIGQSHKKIPCPKLRIFDYPAVIDFSKKNGSYGYGAKSWWGPPRVHFGPMGSHWVKKMGQTRKKITMPQNSNFRLPRGHRFFRKKWKLRLWRQITVETP